MASYLVISPHTAEQCLAALDHLADAKRLDRFEFGCSNGDHTGYARVNAASPDEAISIVPLPDRASVRAIQLERFTAEQLAAIHGSVK
jgi:hypothetical protein